MKIWTLDDGVKLVRALQPEMKKLGYHLALGGSVLNCGESVKDLDLYALPLGNPEIDESATRVIDLLAKLWGNNFDEIRGYAEEPEEFDRVEFLAEPQDYHAPARGLVDVAEMFGAAPVYNPVPPDELVFTKAKKQKRPVYQFKLKWIRPGGDRIDVFIV